jgi:hypothetical protein
MLQLVCAILWNRFITVKQVDKQLTELEKINGGKLDTAERKKIISRQLLFIPVIANSFTRLHKRNTTTQEQERLLQFFINSSLFDDFSDEALLTPLQIAAISFDEKYQPHTFREQLFLHNKEVLDAFANKKINYQQTKKEVYQSQMDSLAQLEPSTPVEELLQISLRKGGHAVALCSYYLEKEISASEQQCWYQLGAIIQLSNDIFDIYKDVQQGIYTYPNCCTNMANLHSAFQTAVNALYENIDALEFSKNSTTQLKIALSGIVALGFTAIAQLQKLQGKSESIAGWKTFQRSQLICDMEKLPTMIKWMKYTYKWGKD